MKRGVSGGLTPILPHCDFRVAAGESAGRRRRPKRGWTFPMKILLRFLGFLFAAGTIVFLVGVGGGRRR